MSDDLIKRIKIAIEGRDNTMSKDGRIIALFEECISALEGQWRPISELEDKQTCWLYTKDLGVFEGCKIGGGFYCDYAISHLTGESICGETVGTDEAKLDPLLGWMPNRIPKPTPPTRAGD